MSQVYFVFLWLIVLLGSALSLWIILFYWEPVGSTSTVSAGGQTVVDDSEDSWRNLVVMKAVATTFLGGMYLIVDVALLPKRLPPVLTQVVWTLVLAAFTAMMVVLGVSLLAHHRELVQMARQPQQSDGNFVADALADGPGSAVKSRVTDQAGRALLLLPLGWLVLALLPLTMATLLALTVVALWSDSTLPVLASATAKAEHWQTGWDIGWAAVAHVATYAFWGLGAVMALSAAHGSHSRRQALSDIAFAAVCAAVLVGFVITQGVWV